ncbi:Transposase domain protein [Methylocystis sp. SC2]|nr:Transposase domain protein [Methylocystis sp. SC2]
MDVQTFVTQRSVEGLDEGVVRWLAWSREVDPGRLVPDHKTIADFRKDNGAAIRKVCAKFLALCRNMGLLQNTSMTVDGSKFKAVNNRDRNFTHVKMARRKAQIERSVDRYLRQLDSADRQEPSDLDFDFRWGPGVGEGLSIDEHRDSQKITNSNLAISSILMQEYFIKHAHRRNIFIRCECGWYLR